MSDEKEKETVTNQDGQDTSAETENTDTENPEQDGSDTPKTVPYERFKEVNEKAKNREQRLAELEAKLSEREEKEEKRRKEQMKEQEKFKELSEELDSELNELKPALEAANERIEKLESILGNHAKSQMDLVPEIFRTAVEKMPLTERLEWLSENREKLAENRPSGIPKTPKGKGKGELNPDERRRKAARTF